MSLKAPSVCLVLAHNALVVIMCLFKKCSKGSNALFLYLELKSAAVENTTRKSEHCSTKTTLLSLSNLCSLLHTHDKKQWQFIACHNSSKKHLNPINLLNPQCGISWLFLHLKRHNQNKEVVRTSPFYKVYGTSGVINPYLRLTLLHQGSENYKNT